MGSVTADYRRWGFILLAMVAWVFLCLPALLANSPEAFQVSGSIIVVMAILIYARERARRENVVTQAQRSQILAMLEEHDNWGFYHESRMARSAMENELQLLELRCSIDNNARLNTDVNTRMEDLMQTLDAGSQAHNALYQQMQNSHSSWVDVHKQAEEVVQSQAPAA